MRKHTKSVIEAIEAGITSPYAISKYCGIYYSQAQREIKLLAAVNNNAFDSIKGMTKYAVEIESAFNINRIVTNIELCSVLGKSRLPKCVLSALSTLISINAIERISKGVGHPVSYKLK